MILYILRHGKAEPGRPGGPDAERRLTPEGKDAVRRVLRRAPGAGVKPETVLVSPYIRAQETAAIAHEELCLSEAPLTTNALTPDSDPALVWDAIRAHRHASQLMLVGHNPLFSELLTLLLAAGGHAVDLKTAGMACVNLGSPGTQPKGRLEWLLTPEVCG